MAADKNNRLSLFMLTSAMVIFGTIGLFRRAIPLSSAMLAFLRGLIGSAFLLIIVIRRQRGCAAAKDRKRLTLLALSGAMIGVNWMLLFEAYNYTTVSVATLCYYMQPVIVILLSPVFFRESLNGKKLACVFAAVLGMILVSGVGSGQAGAKSLAGIAFGLGAAALYACVVMINKKIAGVDAYEKTMIQLGAAALIMVPYLILTGGFASAGTDFTLRVAGLVLIVGLVHTGLAYVLYFASMEGLKAQTIAMLSYIDPVTALLLSAIILHEALTIRGLIGAVLILGAAFISGRED